LVFHAVFFEVPVMITKDKGFANEFIHLAHTFYMIKLMSSIQCIKKFVHVKVFKGIQRMYKTEQYNHIKITFLYHTNDFNFN
jgi:hypothetical protein